MHTNEQTVFDCGHMGRANEFGTTADGKTKCYACCAEEDREFMRNMGTIALYLSVPVEFTGFHRAIGRDCGSMGARVEKGSGRAHVSNWPGSLTIACYVKKGRHNWAGTRYDCWFEFQGYIWHGVCLGEWSQICRCKRTKVKAR